MGVYLNIFGCGAPSFKVISNKAVRFPAAMDQLELLNVEMMISGKPAGIWNLVGMRFMPSGAWTAVLYLWAEGRWWWSSSLLRWCWESAGILAEEQRVSQPSLERLLSEPWKHSPPPLQQSSEMQADNQCSLMFSFWARTHEQEIKLKPPSLSLPWPWPPGWLPPRPPWLAAADEATSHPWSLRAPLWCPTHEWRHPGFPAG